MDEEDEGIDCSPCCRNDRCRKVFISLLLGQVLSLCLCGTAISSQYLAETFKVSTPTTQSFFNYLLLALIYGTILACRQPTEGGLIAVLKVRGWKYLLLALVDVESNYLIVRAYQYTNMTSIQILDCFTIPVVLILSFCFLSVRYLLAHVVGVGICLVGIGCLIWSDTVFNNHGDNAQNKLLGDILCLCGAALYGVGNVGEEYFVKNHPRTEYLGMIGLFGSIISVIQLVIVERDNLLAVPWSSYQISILYVVFAVSMFTFYSMVTIVMRRSGATLFNLSILTADFYALIVGNLVFKNYTFHGLYMLSFALVIVGSIIYSIKPTHKRGAEQPEVARQDYNEIPPNIYTTDADMARPSIGSADGSNSNALYLTDPNVTVKYCPVHGTVMMPRASTPGRAQALDASMTVLNNQSLPVGS